MFKYILLIVAITIACCAGYFSVTGISQLFSATHLAAIIMASALEAGKVISISFLFRYWKDINKLQRYYLIFSSVIISTITSFGIYGFLSAAYSTAAVSYKVEQSKIDVLTTQQNSINNLIAENQKTIDLTRSSIQHQDNRLDSLVGKNGFISQQQNNNQSNKRLDILQKENITYIKQRDSLELLRVQQNAQLSTTSKIGTFNYIANLLHTQLDTVAKYFILIIVLVFDPLSLNLILAYNFIVKKELSDKNEPTTPTIEEKIDLPTPDNISVPAIEQSDNGELDTIEELKVEIPSPVVSDITKQREGFSPI